MKTRFVSRNLAAILPLGAVLLGTGTMAMASPFDNAFGKHLHQENGALKRHERQERANSYGDPYLRQHQAQERNAENQHQRSEGRYYGGRGNGGYYGNNSGGYYGGNNGNYGNSGGYYGGNSYPNAPDYNGNTGGYYGGNNNGGYYGNNAHAREDDRHHRADDRHHQQDDRHDDDDYDAYR